MKYRRAGAWMVAASLVTGCSDEEGAALVPPPVTVVFRPANVGPTPFGDVPWPSDLYLSGDRVGPVPGLDRIAASTSSLEAGLASLDAFGRSAGAVLFTDGPIDDASLPHAWADATDPTAAVFIATLDPDAAQRGERLPSFARYLPSLGCISILPAPGVVLRPGLLHAVVVTTRARASSGAALAPSPELARIAALPEAERTSAAEHLYGSAIEELVAAGVVGAPSDVAGVAVFTTSRRVEELPILRSRLRELPEPEWIVEPSAVAPYTAVVFGVASEPSLDDWLGAPDLDERGVPWPGGDNPGGIAHDAIGAVASGAFVAPTFLDLETGHFEKDDLGQIVLADEEATIPVTIVVPSSPAPPAGYPVVISGHGLSNHRGSMFSFANELARAGFVVVGIDDVLHGARAGVPDEVNNYPGTYDGPDGIPDEMPLPIDFFAGFTDFVAVRDNFRQTVLDQTSLVRLVQSSALDLSALAVASGGPVPTLDPTRIYWSGGSLGGIMGAMTIAVEPEIDAAALHVPGASFVQLITTNSAKVSPLVSTIAGGTFGYAGNEVLDEFHPVASLLTAITEAGDPIAYAPHVLGDSISGREPADVLVTYAIDDEVLPNVATVALIRALGLELATPNLEAIPGVATVASPVEGNVAGRAAAAVQYAPSNHGLGYVRYDVREFYPDVPLATDPRFPPLPTPIQIETPIREHASQLVAFLSSARDGRARIEVTAPPVADFDADGSLDEDDADPVDPDVP